MQVPASPPGPRPKMLPLSPDDQKPPPRPPPIKIRNFSAVGDSIKEELMSSE